jgi:hypothetical protein
MQRTRAMHAVYNCVAHLLEGGHGVLVLNEGDLHQRGQRAAHHCRGGGGMSDATRVRNARFSGNNLCNCVMIEYMSRASVH